MINRRFWPAVLTAVLTLSLCVAFATNVSASQHPAKTQLKVAMLFSSAVAGNSWDGNGYTGLKDIKKKLGAKIAYTENVQLADIQQTASNYARQGYNLIYGNGFEYGQPFSQIASQFPNTKFVAITGVTKAKNLQSPQFAENEAGYLAGVVAGMMTKKNKIGCVGGQEQPFVVSDLEGMVLGAKYVNKKVKFHITYTGSFTDIAKARQAANALVDSGVDVLCQKDDNGGPAVIAVAKQRHIWAIGDSQDQNNLAPKNVLTSAVIFTPKIILEIAQSVASGKFKGGMPSYGVKQNAAGLSPYHGLVPKKVQNEVKKVIKLIKKGKIKVPLITKPKTP